MQGLTPHPDKIAETNSLSSVAPPKLPYKMSLPGHVMLSALPFKYVNACWSRMQSGVVHVSVSDIVCAAHEASHAGLLCAPTTAT